MTSFPIDELNRWVEHDPEGIEWLGFAIDALIDHHLQNPVWDEYESGVEERVARAYDYGWEEGYENGTDRDISS
jgi:hypothetical protein